MPISVGTKAPDFTLKTKRGEDLKDIKLSDNFGKKKTILLFFPLAFTGVCTAEMCAFGDDFDAFASRDVAVLPISIDAVPSLKEFKAKHAMRVELASDFKREVSRAYGTLIEERFFSTRAYFLIDKTGVLRWSFVEDTPGTRRENSEILAEIAKLGA